MAETKVTSNQYRLSKSDWLKGFIIGVGTPLLYVVQEMIPGWNIPPLAKAAISATATYLIKNFVDKPKVVITDQETVTQIKEGEAEIKVIPK